MFYIAVKDTTDFGKTWDVGYLSYTTDDPAKALEKCTALALNEMKSNLDVRLVSDTSDFGDIAIIYHTNGKVKAYQRVDLDTAEHIWHNPDGTETVYTGEEFTDFVDQHNPSYIILDAWIDEVHYAPVVQRPHGCKPDGRRGNRKKTSTKPRRSC